MNRLTKLEEPEDARQRLFELLDARVEWLLRERRDGPAVELRRGLWELRVATGTLLFSYWGEAGSRVWRVEAWAWEGERLLLDASRRTGAERARLELVPRASIASAREAVAAARREACERLAALVCDEAGVRRAERASLSAGARRGEPGRWARITLRRGREHIAATGPVVPARAADAEDFLASALLWHARLEGSTRDAHPQQLRLVAPSELAAAVCERVALLHDRLRALTTVFEVDEECRALTQLRVPALDELLDAPAPRLFRHAPPSPSQFVESVVALAPEAVDVVRSRRGETLRFNGLPFARVRRLMNQEHAWFGVEGSQRRRLLEDESAADFLKLVAELKEHRRAHAAERHRACAAVRQSADAAEGGLADDSQRRRAGASDHRHALYRAAPEAWLESLLRRDITRLDSGLRLAPLHAQFRATRAAPGASRPVDLLALRRDGRLVVVELKVSEDAALALQGADYWRRVEAHRRQGNIARARLFDDAGIADEPPLVYLVAPMLRFHRSFATLARAVNARVEMYRFDIAEEWRAGVRVVRRQKVG
ncbi:MAG TPA: hypothetical protein VHU19_02575 [Pyrinomonadaceae bacterium]|nr:hypothetical protein [Pyrinomonadaceae bacterium]